VIRALSTGTRATEGADLARTLGDEAGDLLAVRDGCRAADGDALVVIGAAVADGEAAVAGDEASADGVSCTEPAAGAGLL
jgi:hypothetical protein